MFLALGNVAPVSGPTETPSIICVCVYTKGCLESSGHSKQKNCTGSVRNICRFFFFGKKAACSLWRLQSRANLKRLKTPSSHLSVLVAEKIVLNWGRTECRVHVILQISLHQHHTAAGQNKNETYVTVMKNVKIFPLQESGSLFVKFDSPQLYSAERRQIRKCLLHTLAWMWFRINLIYTTDSANVYSVRCRVWTVLCREEQVL